MYMYNCIAIANMIKKKLYGKNKQSVLKKHFTNS